MIINIRKGAQTEQVGTWLSIRLNNLFNTYPHKNGTETIFEIPSCSIEVAYDLGVYVSHLDQEIKAEERPGILCATFAGATMERLQQTIQEFLSKSGALSIEAFKYSTSNERGFDRYTAVLLYTTIK